MKQNAYEESEALRAKSARWFARYVATGEITGAELLVISKPDAP